MPTTRATAAQYKEYFAHLMSITFELSDEDPIQLALANEGIEDPFELMSLTPNELVELEYESGNITKKLARREVHHLHHYLKYATYIEEQGIEWLSTNPSTYHDFKHSADFLSSTSLNLSSPPSMANNKFQQPEQFGG